jgi:hypothetical protein
VLDDGDSIEQAHTDDPRFTSDVRRTEDPPASKACILREQRVMARYNRGAKPASLTHCI